MDSTTKSVVNEAVLASWTSTTGYECTLGSPTSQTKSDGGLTMRATLDEEKRVWFRLSLSVMAKTAMKERNRELTLLIPPQSLGKDRLSFESVQISKIGTPALYSAVDDARLFDSGQVIRANLTLAMPGRVLMPKTRAKKVIPASTTTDMLRGLRSLSHACSFSVYLKPGDYALERLKLVCNPACNAIPMDKAFVLEDVLDKKTTEMNWNLYGLEPERDPTPGSLTPAATPPPVPSPASAPAVSLTLPLRAPPAYIIDSTLPSLEVLVRATPRRSTRSVHNRSNAGTSVLPVTYLDGGDAPPPPRNKEVYEDTNEASKEGTNEAPDEVTNKNTNESTGAFSRKRPLSPTADAHEGIRKKRPSTFDVLICTFNEWLQAALIINSHAYAHPRLQTHLWSCVHHAANCNITPFIEARAALSAEFYYDPYGTDTSIGRESYVADMTTFLEWTLRTSLHADSTRLDEFLDLGRAAREAATKGPFQAGPEEVDEEGVNYDNVSMLEDPYRAAKALCVQSVLSCEEGVGLR